MAVLNVATVFAPLSFFNIGTTDIQLISMRLCQSDNVSSKCCWLLLLVAVAVVVVVTIVVCNIFNFS